MPPHKPGFSSSLRLGLTLALTLSLAACSNTPAPGAKDPYAGGVSYPWTDRVTLDPNDPYAGGRVFSWRGPGAPLVSTALSPTAITADSYLSDVDWTPGTAVNAWGPIEKNLSNGEQNAGDGRTLSIKGQTFAKGLGVHAGSSVSYALGSSCSTFTASVGIDDEVGGRGSVVFQVFADGTKIYDSGVVRGGEAARPVSVSVAGKSELKLVVTDGGDGINYDHADWAGAQVSCTTQSPPPSGESFLSDRAWSNPTNGWGPIEQDLSNGEQGLKDGRTLTIGGAPFAKGLGMHANGSVSYGLSGQCSTFTASVGVDDEVGDRGSVVFQVYADGTKIYDSGVVRGVDAARPVSVSVAGKNELKLVVTDGGDSVNYDHADWGGARVSCTTTQTGQPTLPVQVNFQPAASSVPSGYIGDTGAAYDATRGFGWIREDSVGTGSSVPLDVTPNTRDRALPGLDARLNTMVHMQFPSSVSNSTAVRTPAAWEYALPNGVYSVTVAVGDASNTFDSQHQINVEGQLAVARYTPTESKKFITSTVRASVTDGRLTVDARGGTNTKLDYVTIQPGDRPSVRVTSPQDGETIVPTTVSITADVNVLNGGIDGNTLTSSTVRLIDAATNAPVPATVNTSGGGDVIVLKPNAQLAANKQYIFEITDGVKDTSGATFLPRRLSFVTGASPPTSALAFEQVALANVPVKPYTAVEMSPDGKLYAATSTGEILRFGVQPDGTVTVPQVIKSVQTANGGPRTIIGMKFDPASTADNPVMWISNNYFWNGMGESPDWSGKITRLSGPNLENVQDYVVGLPRSIRDHMTNSISFRPADPGALYVLQGSNTAMGAPDSAWGNRPERLLTAALLRVDLSKITSPPLDVKTAEGGLYNPYPTSAPVRIFASGIRNAYDMVWHTNGQLYVPTNGSAAGGNTPGTPATLPASCQTRLDSSSNGPYTGPAVPALTGVSVQRDYLFRVVSGGYYGHPNPLRCEWVMNGGNPTSGLDTAEVVSSESGTGYAVGVLPDRNWKGFSYDFGNHASPNGVIEEYRTGQNTALKNKLLVVRYSAGKDIIVLTPGGTNQDIVGAETLITGLTDFNPSPLDLVENRSTGHLYVAQLDERTGSGKITLVRPK